jgi:hypothetical protein
MRMEERTRWVIPGREYANILAPRYHVVALEGGETSRVKWTGRDNLVLAIDDPGRTIVESYDGCRHRSRRWRVGRSS